MVYILGKSFVVLIFFYVRTQKSTFCLASDFKNHIKNANLLKDEYMHMLIKIKFFRRNKWRVRPPVLQRNPLLSRRLGARVNRLTFLPLLATSVNTWF